MSYFRATRGFGLLLASILIGSLIGYGALVVGQQPTLSDADRADLAVLMRAKLMSTQKIVEGLMDGDFNLNTESAIKVPEVLWNWPNPD